jgi:hypothetical protein
VNSLSRASVHANPCGGIRMVLALTKPVHTFDERIFSPIGRQLGLEGQRDCIQRLSATSQSLDST